MCRAEVGISQERQLGNMKLTLISVYVLTLMFARCLNTAVATVGLVPEDSSNVTVVSGQKQPLAKFAALLTDECGGTYVKYCKFEGLSFRSYAPPAEPQWVGPLPDDEVKGMTVAILPKDYVGTWHTAPGPQFVVTLSGGWSLEATNGQILTQYAGDWHFDGDTSSKPRPNDPRVGHLTRALGNEPCVQLVISFKNYPSYVNNCE